MTRPRPPGLTALIALLPVVVALAMIPDSGLAQKANADPKAATPPPERSEGKSYIEIVGGSARDLPLALPPFKLGSGAEQSGADVLYEVVKRDLELSGYFKLLDPAAYVEPESAGVAPGEFDFEHWRLPNATGLVKARESVVSGDELVFDLHVYNVEAGIELLARELRGTADDQRRLAHRVSNAVIEAFTGEPGIFDTEIVAVANLGAGKEIYVFDYDGANRRPVSRNGSINLSPAWAPDGRRITYTSYRDDNPDLWLTDLDTGRHRKISSHPGINAGAEWSPDGGEIALTLSKDGDSEIYAIEPSGSIIRRLTRQWGIDVSPTFSPDGQTIAFVSARNGGPQVFLMDRDGSNPRLLVHRGGHNVSPAFSPDGLKLAFAGRDEGRFDIFVTNLDGTGLKRLTQTEGDDEDPTWSPDGNHILFTSSRDGRGKQLYIMTADGRFQTRVTEGSGSFSNPMWGPRTVQN